MSLKGALDDFLPCTVIELLLRDGNRSSVKFERVIFRVEVLEAEVIAFHGRDGCRKQFDFGALGCVALHG